MAPTWGLLLILVFVSACTGSDTGSRSSTTPGDPQAYCPALVGLFTESVLAGSTIGDDAGPEAMHGPEYAGVRDAFGELLSVLPERERRLAEEASFDRAAGETVDEEAARAMWLAIADLPPTCVPDLPETCTERLTQIRQSPLARPDVDDELRALDDDCLPADGALTAYTGECRAVATAVLLEDGDSTDEGVHLAEYLGSNCEIS